MYMPDWLAPPICSCPAYKIVQVQRLLPAYTYPKQIQLLQWCMFTNLDKRRPCRKPWSNRLSACILHADTTLWRHLNCMSSEWVTQRFALSHFKGWLKFRTIGAYLICGLCAGLYRAVGDFKSLHCNGSHIITSYLHRSHYSLVYNTNFRKFSAWNSVHLSSRTSVQG